MKRREFAKLGGLLAGSTLAPSSVYSLGKGVQKVTLGKQSILSMTALNCHLWNTRNC